MTALLFLPFMEWIGSNSSRADAFVLGSFEIGVRSLLATWGHLLPLVMIGVVVIWGPVYYALMSARRSSVAIILGAGASTAFVAALLLYFVFVMPLNLVFRFPKFAAHDFVYAFRCALGAALVGLIMAAAFRLAAPEPGARV